MSITPYPVQAFRDGKWDEVLSSDLVPGDLVSVRKSPQSPSRPYINSQSEQNPILVSHATSSYSEEHVL
jgi:magnesium-transporting ATPase (P-type)